MRILKGYSKQERKELEEAKDNGFLSAIALINGFGGDDGDCHALSEKYCHEYTNDNNQLAKDIADFYCGNAKFSDKKYYVHFIKRHGSPYLNINTDGEVELSNNSEFGGWKTKFTIDEVVAINPKFVPFMEEVED